jgi:tetratricopeptide (TPR) repeat protein
MPTSHLVTFISIVLTVVAASTLSVARADEITCGSLENAFGPLDYRTEDRKNVRLVEGAHFTPDVERLKAGNAGYLGGDIDYTLRAFPNHPRALVSMMNLQFKEKTERPQGTRWPVPCYFDRALRFRPDDPTVHEIYGIYLMRTGKKAEAIEQLNRALSLAGDNANANLHYNLGLAYFEVRDYDNAALHAKKAYDLGFQLSGLKSMLGKVGKWPPAE